MSFKKLPAAIRIIISMLILCMIESGIIISRYDSAIVILCFIELIFDTCYIVIKTSVEE